jgi:hypothetical protein
MRDLQNIWDKLRKNVMSGKTYGLANVNISFSHRKPMV